ncbi:MAG: hypothetical protein M3N54_14425 [Acidobacteriota bacterium]|nr:hypothetical protein [Acidobacteriota bacterium]
MACLAAIAISIGIAPAAWLSHRPVTTLWFGAGVGILALLAPRKLTRDISGPEYTFEFTQMLGKAAVMGGAYMVTYGALLAIFTILHLISHSSWFQDPGRIAYHGALLVTGLFTFFLAIGMWDEIRKRMALPAEGGDTWYPAIEKPTARSLAVTTGIWFAFIALFWWVWPGAALITAELFLLIVLAEFKEKDGAQPRGLKAIGRLFEASGYKVTLQPQIGDKSVDAFLKRIDLFAEAEFFSFAVGVLSADFKPAPVDWTLASSLRAAASLYASKPDLVHCMLLLLGAPADPSLRAFGEREGVQVIELPDAQVTLLAEAADSQETLRKIAREYLHLDPAMKGAAQP